MSEYRVVLCTAGHEEGKKLGRALVKERLAACVNIVPGVTSVYTWEGSVCEDEESLLLVKTTEGRMSALTKRIEELHSYDVPEVVGIRLQGEEGNGEYLRWLRAVVEG